MTTNRDTFRPTHDRDPQQEQKDHHLLLRTFYEEGRLNKPKEPRCYTSNPFCWIWGAIAVLTVAGTIGLIRLEFIATEQAKRTDAINLIRYSMTHPDINQSFTKSHKNN